MSNYKVKVNTEDESREVQEFLKKNGYERKHSNFKLVNGWVCINKDNEILCACISQSGDELNDYKELTIPQLKDLVVLKRNDKNDRNVIDPEEDANLYLDSDNKLFVFHLPTQTWKKSNLNGEEEVMERLKPIIKPLKEYLVPQDNGKYALTKATEKRVSDWVEVPDGMNFAHKDEFNIHFTKLEMGYRDSIIVWQRHTQPEELPFVDDEPKSLNDTYAEIEQVRQDNVNNPSHYSDSSIECIDAMEAMMTPEQFIGYLRGNVFKYQWRYEKKNGIEDLKKAQWYLDKLVAKVNEKHSFF